MKRSQARVSGVVQGVGFRPFVYRTAASLGLTGWVKNCSNGVLLEVQGNAQALATFFDRLETSPPPGAEIDYVAVASQSAQPTELGFRVLQESPEAPLAALDPGGSIAPDRAVCAACLDEVATAGTRRHGYAFTSCTACGPRATLVESLPYEREHTTMRHFPLCDACRKEYDAPSDRRFRAETLACPTCGPQLRLVEGTGATAATGDPVYQAAEHLRRGNIVAVLGLGGFQLLANACDRGVVARLRDRKGRPHKPLAVMFRNLTQLAESATPTAAELDALTSSQAPIVLLRAKVDTPLAANIAPGQATVGALLPYTPLHQLLMDAVHFPVVCTSGNVSGEPLCTTLEQAQMKLGEVADAFLTHDRPIARAMDDSVVHLGHNGVEFLRRARGYSPGCVAKVSQARCTLALGAHYKSTVALISQGHLVVSQHIGDLETMAARRAHHAAVDDLLAFYAAKPEAIACDLHPDYGSSQLATTLATAFECPLITVQHHHAHVAAVLAEHDEQGEVLAFAWDGLGLGTDGKLWGSEVLLCTGTTCRRSARLSDFPLPGGERAQREPRRALLGLCHAVGIELPQSAARYFERHERTTLENMLQSGLNCPATSSMGRLFDAVAALLGLHGKCTYEGQAAVALEHLALGVPGAVGHYTLDACAGPSPLLPLVSELIADQRKGTASAVIARRFHNTLIRWALAHAKQHEKQAVVLAGGCFQNRQLSAGLTRELETAEYRVLRPRRLPSNDGQIAAGQAWLAAHGQPKVIGEELRSCA